VSGFSSSLTSVNNIENVGTSRPHPCARILESALVLGG